jgi:transcriptional regulator with XRE-family HTH domain
MPTKPKTVQRQLIDAMRRAERRGLTRYKIACKTGISQATLSHIIHGKAIPRLDRAEKIAEAMGCRIALIDEKTT